MTTSLRAATVQFHHRANDKNYNLSVIEGFIAQAATEHIQV
ncbi:MAG: acyltransferase, partial [Serratia sp. (in: enterobacteria)]